jgi:L1 cell adhesion molecule like protein
MPRGQPKIVIDLSIDVNGILEVTAKEESTGKTNNIKITNDKGRLSKEQIEEMVKAAEKYKEEDEKNKQLLEAKNELENYLYNTKNSVATKAEGAPETFDEVKAEIDPIVEEGLKWFEENPKLEIEDYKNKQKEYEAKIKPLITKLYGAVPPQGETVASGTGPAPFETTSSAGFNAGGEGGPKVKVNIDNNDLD